MRVGLFGGSFNPPHLGHLLIAERALEALDLERLVWIPAHRSPHKTGDSLAAPRDRLVMTELAIRGNPRFSVSDTELDRPPPSFTVDTVRRIRAEHPTWKLTLLVGGDSAASFGRWKDPEAIAELAEIVAYPRGFEGPSSPAISLAQYGIREITAPRIEISSTEIRSRIALGNSVRYMIPDAVLSYIHAHKLYG